MVTMRKSPFFAIIVGSFLLASEAFAVELEALCSAAKQFVNAAKAQEGILITYRTANELAASTIEYAAAKKRYFLELRAAMPILIAIGVRRGPPTAETEEVGAIFRQFSVEDEEQVARATIQVLQRFENDQAVAAAEKEFERAQEIEAAFEKDFDGLDGA
jgi:hypothetical protein